MPDSSAIDAAMNDDPTPAHPSVWRFAKASRAHVVIDAAAYFTWMHTAMLNARQRILLIGWDFDSRIRLAGGRRWWNLPSRERPPARLGAFMIWLTKRTPGLTIRILKWNFGALRYLFRGSMIVDLFRWLLTPKIDFKFDAAHPLGCSHHQKIVVIDDKLAVCGGIDMTGDRWDTPDHIHNDARRRKINGKPYGPWHDVTMLVEGDAAAAIGDLGRDRWEVAGGKPLSPCLPQDQSPWPERLNAEFTDVEIGIARTRAAYNDCPEVREIELLYREQIAAAKKFIYAESQYFASRAIAEAIAKRLAAPNPPEIVIINPLSADGWLEQKAMDGARVRLLQAVGLKDPGNRFRVYVPMTSGGEAIYVHAKLMIVDDEIIRVGSANMNNRSMGLDTEADVFIDANRPGNEHIVSAVRRLRIALLAEHCGVTPEHLETLLAEHGDSMNEAVAAVKSEGKYLQKFEIPEMTEADKAVADNAMLDPERPEEMFEMMSEKRGLFRRGGFLRKPK